MGIDETVVNSIVAILNVTHFQKIIPSYLSKTYCNILDMKHYSYFGKKVLRNIVGHIQSLCMKFMNSSVNVWN